ncbi:M20 aminoacylase family protein [Tranquillimonas alkanivorans]|uniref:Hippurate hydrolase n=1 Tax=Tranquillimonas alkanivorans TaxID=441119 RepID=A0A1I5QML8_9RHOB|nr:M20 aminoacylase family protein [Tranquillimonas alkanivorans]SFP47485.1 hippurate hydrolase [Tranquillimonas alkanivorans]
MPVVNRIAEFARDMAEWRQWMHRNPELGFDCHRTAAFVADRLREFGVDEVHEGVAQTGVVAVIEGQGEGPTIGLRADMDALPMNEETGADYASETPGKMHACGHDGHTAMLLGAARYLAETRNFAGRVALMFQPAEEVGGGGGVMVEEGVLDRFDIGQVYALHNAPGVPVGRFETGPGPIMASVDEFDVTFRGQGGHAAHPDLAVDPIPPALAFAQGCDTVVSRNRPPTEPMVVSVTQIHAGSAFNVIPGTSRVGGTVRCFSEKMRDLAERRIRTLAEAQAAAFGAEVTIDYLRDYPPTVNHAEQAAFAAGVAREVAGEDKVVEDRAPQMGAEDFAYMLQARPGAYLFLGQGEGPFCHHPAYDFNDEIAPIGASFFVRLVETAQPVHPAAAAR